MWPGNAEAERLPESGIVSGENVPHGLRISVDLRSFNGNADQRAAAVNKIGDRERLKVEDLIAVRRHVNNRVCYTGILSILPGVCQILRVLPVGENAHNTAAHGLQFVMNARQFWKPILASPTHGQRLLAFRRAWTAMRKNRRIQDMAFGFRSGMFRR